MVLFWLFLISLNTLILRLFVIGNVPPMKDGAYFELRTVSVMASIYSVIILFLIVKKISGNSVSGLISSWVYSILPWAIEQGRIVSYPLFFSSVFLTFLLISLKIKNNLLKRIFPAFSFLFIPLFYPDFFLLKMEKFSFSLNDFINNIVFLLSPDFLFFRNTTFYFGGVKDAGIIYLSLLPFLLLGIYFLTAVKKTLVLNLILFFLIVSSLSPYLPESREFYLTLPFFSVVIAEGIRKFKGRNLKLTLILALFLIYEISQYLHFYMTHYPLEVIKNLDKINVSF